MTNADNIKAMNTWQLAEFIHAVSCNTIKITTCTDLCDECEFTDEWCISGIAEWLKEQKNE